MNRPCHASAERAVGDPGEGNLQCTTPVFAETLYIIEAFEDVEPRRFYESEGLGID